MGTVLGFADSQGTRFVCPDIVHPEFLDAAASIPKLEMLRFILIMLV